MLGDKPALSRNFIILSASDWDSGGGGSSGQQFARAMSRRGYRYAFVGPTQRSKAYKIIENKGISLNKTVIFCELPQEDYLDICKFFKKKDCEIVYRIVDWWAHMPKNDWYVIELEIELIKFADLCYATSQALVDKFRKVRNDIKLLPNGVDKEQFSRLPLEEPADLRKGEITIGFWGSFWCDWFDWNLIEDVARKKPNWTFNLIGGNPQKLRAKINKIPDNVNSIGQKNWHELFKYLHYFDVCIIPYTPKAGSNEANPVKALEYLAGYKPIVSYYNESLKEIPYVHFYKDEFDFINNIEKAKNIKIDKIIVDSFLENNTWECRLETILNEVDKVNVFSK